MGSPQPSHNELTGSYWTVVVKRANTDFSAVVLQQSEQQDEVASVANIDRDEQRDGQ